MSFPGIKTVILHSFIFVGSAYEKAENNGVSHFLEHMLFRGNAKLGDDSGLSLKIEELGGELNAATSFDVTEFWLEFHYNYLERGIEYFCQFLQYPLFQRIEIERAIIVEEIKAEYNAKNDLINIDSLSAARLWPSHPLGLPVIGTLKTIKKISKDDLAALHREYYQPGNMIIGVSGDFDAPMAVDLIGRQFKGYDFSPTRFYAPVVSHQVGEQISLTFEQDNQFNIQWNFVSHIGPEFYLRCQLIRQILDDGYSSRLQRLLREEKGLVYDISADLSCFRQGALFSINASVSPDRFEKLIIYLTELIRDLIREGIFEDELRLAKLRRGLAEERENDSAEGKLYSIVNSLISPGAYSPDTIQSRLKEVDLESVNKIATNLFNQKQSCFVMIGPWRDEHKKFLESRLSPWLAKGAERFRIAAQGRAFAYETTTEALNIKGDQ